MPILGGMEACDERWGAKWRTHFTCSDQKFFSRMGLISKSIQQQAVIQEKETTDVLKGYETIFHEQRKSVAGLIVELTNLGFIVQRGRRVRRS